MKPPIEGTEGRVSHFAQLRISDAQAGALIRRRRQRGRARRGGLFLKGPIPWSWLAAAARLPGKALHVGVVFWFLAGLQRGGRVALSSQVLADAGVQRHAGYRALQQLEKAGLVAVTRHVGRAPVVVVREPSHDPSTALADSGPAPFPPAGAP